MKIPNTVRIVERALEDQFFRKELVFGAFFWFSHFYFPDSFRLPSSNSHKEMMRILESDTKGTLLFAAARKFGKSTIACEHYPLWEILVRRRRKSAVIASRSLRQAEDHLANIRRDIENPANILFLRDWGPMQLEEDQLGRQSLTFPRLGSRILAASTETSIRGMKFRAERPDLVILDDIETSESVMKLESRDKIFRWLYEDVVPAMGDDGRIIFLGTPLDSDSVLMRTKQAIESGGMPGIVRFYPIVDGAGQPLWPARYPTPESVEDEKKKVGERSFRQEFMLEIVSEDEQAIRPQWLQYYDRVFDRDVWTNFRFRIISIDQAFSGKQTADKTAIIRADVFGYGSDTKIFILPNPINKRMTPREVVNCVKALVDESGERLTYVVAESVADLSNFGQLLRDAKIRHLIEVRPRQDKHTRQVLAGAYVEEGQVFFPANDPSVKELLSQLLNFPRCRFDDLADSFSQLVLEAMNQAKKSSILHPKPQYPVSSYADRYLTNELDQERLRKEADLEADRQLMLESEYMRSGRDPTMAPWMRGKRNNGQEEQ